MSDPATLVSKSPRVIGTAPDHGGFELKQQLILLLRAAGHHVVDFGDHRMQPEDDYPDFVIPLARPWRMETWIAALLYAEVEWGPAWPPTRSRVFARASFKTVSPHQGVEDDNLDVICLGGRVVGIADAWELVQVFLAANFTAGERHRRRLQKVAVLENKSPQEAAS